MSHLWLGIDIGTGGSRAILVDERGKIRATCSAAHQDVIMERPLWAEQDPCDWWSAAQKAIRGAIEQAGVTGKDIAGVGLSGQMHGLVMLDAGNQVIRPALIWCDQRSQAQVDEINKIVGREAILSYIANPVLTGFTLPKLLWVRENDPASYARTRHVLLPKDYIRFELTGEFASEVSDASGTALFDVVNRCWSKPMIEALNLDAGWLPRVFESSEVTGRISAAAAALTGLVAGTPVAGGGGDQAASAVGNGIVEAGLVSCTVGTSGVVFAHTDTASYDPGGRVHTFCHAVPGAWHVMGVTQGAGLSLQWLRNELFPGKSYDELTALAATAEPGSQGLFWLPYLMGERTPHLDASARGGWVGLTARQTRADLVRSLLEGVSYSQKDCLDIITGMGIPVASVRLSGGGARSHFWRQMFADVFDKPVVTLETQEGSAYGAAILSQVATGAFATVPEACRAVVAESETVQADASAASFYSRGHQIYDSLYPALHPAFGAIAKL
jgi:xylulokinase